jgi:hypothetical protein
MLMTNELTPLAVFILDTLEARRGVWLTRQEIASAIGRPARLTPHDIDLLETLVTAGRVEKSERQTGVVQTAYIYRIK